MSCESSSEFGQLPSNALRPLTVEEVICCLRSRWQVTYDLQLVVRGKSLYLQMMWAYLEQKSFPLEEDAFLDHLSRVLDVVNRLGNSELVRQWLATTPKRPRIGFAISLSINAKEGCLEEFLL